MALPHVFGFIAVGQAIRRILSDRFQQPVPWRLILIAIHQGEGLVHERRQQVQDLELVGVVRHTRCGVQRPASGEHRQHPKKTLLRR